MEHLDYSKILEKLGKEKNFSVLTEEEHLFYDVVRAIKYVSASEEKNKINQSISHPTQQDSKTTVHRIPFILSTKTWLRIAAGIAIFITAYLFLQKKETNLDEVYSNYFKQENSYLPTAVEKLEQYSMVDLNAGSRDSLLAGLKFYEKLQFDQATKILSSYSNQYPEEYTSRFYLALSYMHLDQFDLAEQHLALLKDIDQIQFAQDIKWYYILCLLKSEHGREKAKELLEKLKSEPGKYHKQAAEVFQII